MSMLRNFRGIALGSALIFSSVPVFAEECNETTMDAFAYEDCIAAKNGEAVDNSGFKKKNSEDEPVAPKEEKYSPFGKPAYLTSSFGENRGTRYHMGIDYSTDMKEGWPVYAPEDGVVKDIKITPFGYGKVMYFKGNSGVTWVFAHQSSFGPHLDSLAAQKMVSSKKNDIALSPNTSYKKGDTLTFAGSTGIGNPHLHLEMRTADNRGLSPCTHGVLCTDTIAPQVFAAAVMYKNDVAFTSQEALDAGCIETPIQNTYENESSVKVAFKIADYSRHPKENPMSVRRVEVFRYDDKIYSKIQDTISFSNQLKIRDELLWAEEADTLGDWHYIKAELPPQSDYTLEVEDYVGNVTKKKFNLRSNCKNNEPFKKQHFQETPLFTYLARSMISFEKCGDGYSFSAYDAAGTILESDLCSKFPKKFATVAKIGELYPNVAYIKYKNGSEDKNIYVYIQQGNSANISWTAKFDGMEISQKISGLTHITNEGNVSLAFVKNHTDSLDFLEFHPKGLQLTGKWDVCIDSKTAANPLYWLGETKRGWNYFSKQTKGKTRCVSINELRDIASINDQRGPILGFAYWSNTIVGGLHVPALKIPVLFRYGGVPNGNAITVKAKNKWIPLEFDSEPNEIVLIGENLPEDGESLNLQIVDDSGRKSSFEVIIPEM